MMNIFRDNRGMAAVELGLSLPLLFLLFIGSFEMTRYIQINQKLEKAVNMIADITAQSDDISAVELNNLVSALDHIMAPYSFGANGRVIVTSVAKTNPNPATVRWQYCGGGKTAASFIGTPGSAASLPNGLTLNDKEDIIIAEIYYDFTPILDQDIIGIGELSKRAIYRPRLGALDNFVSSCS